MCVKQVPDTWSEKRLVEGDATLDRVSADGVMNELDEYAVEEALRLGLVDRLAPAADVLTDALAWAGEFARGPGIALAEAKRVIDAGLDRPLMAGLALEQQAFAGLFATEDRRIGMASFIEEGPGKARFTGR